jgi:H+/Cl- antiporter ClcA/CBS domain-containing protein
MQAVSHRRDFGADWRLLRITAIAAVLGVLSTLAGSVLLYLIRVCTNLFFYQRLSGALAAPADNTLGWWVIPVPVVGGLLIGQIARYGSDKIRGHGIPEAIEAILFGKSKMSPRVALLKPLSSAIAIGSGGPFGAEGPIIMTGASIGSLVAQHFHLTGGERKTLLVAGAVAGMTAIFGTPLAAVLLAVELLLFELRPRSLLPVAIACAVAGFTRPWLFEPGALFPLATAVPAAPELLGCVLAGLASGMLAWLLSTALYRVEDGFARLPLHWMWWPALGALVVGIGGFLQPRALGVGYDVIGDLLHNRLALGVLVALLSCKAVMWVVALGSGTSGGVLAPLLMLGAALGSLLVPWMPGHDPALWPLVFMAATLGGMMRAPVMAAIFALELTHDINAMLPLLAATSVAYGFTVLVMPRSILTEKIARRGYHIYREYGIDPLERQHVGEVMSTAVVTIDAALTVEQARARFFGPDQRHRAFPVLQGAEVLGVVGRAALEAAPGAALVGSLLVDAPPLATAGETCRALAARMAALHLECLPVVTDLGTRHLAGIVSRSDLLKPAAALFEEEQHREQLRTTPADGLRDWLRRRRA